ncbi:hypothetical protein BH10BAC5_BH10BAC5_17080 [soil metagenome]
MDKIQEYKWLFRIDRFRDVSRKVKGKYYYTWEAVAVQGSFKIECTDASTTNLAMLRIDIKDFCESNGITDYSIKEMWENLITKTINP